MMITTNADVAGKVRGAAAEKRQSQSDLAVALNISSMAMSRRFSGKTPFAPEELAKLATTLGVTVGSFFGERAA